MKRLRLVLLLLLLLLLAAGGFAFWTYRELRVPRAHTHAAEYVEIPRGSSPSEIVAKLTSLGVLERGWPLLVYMKLTGTGSKLKAGEYRFQTPISPLEVLHKLQEGEERMRRFTVIEGWTRWDIAEALARVPELKLQNSAEALALMDDAGAVRDLDPRAENLEGYLYPDTYTFPLDTTAEQMVALMVKRFRQEWKPEWTARAAELKMTPRQIVTIASLIETEAKLQSDRPLIASVIYNRLDKQMALGVDSSIIYASKLAGKWKNDGKVYKSDLERNTPYNTRLHAGLPPGPIASPSASSLQAALFPATTDYLYYVREPSRNDGAHNFYNNERDFTRGVEALRQWERDRDAAKSQANQNANAP
ncbi:MAG: endolytic transglycosylase MltG [Acidobacteria bacterium]|nr:endolytic transglycosylase MltG [Acidobacteriota bacterium]